MKFINKKIIILLITSFYFNTYGQVSFSKYNNLTSEGLEQLEKQNIASAIDKYKKALAEKHDGIEANYGLGVCYSAICIQNGNYCDDAILYLLKAEKIDKGYRNTYRNICACFIKTFQFQNAIEYADKAIVQNKKDSESYFYRGFAKLELAKNKEACADLQQASILGFKEATRLLIKYCK